jgi:N-6 DNA Methylase
MFQGTPQLPKQSGEERETRRDFHLDAVRVELLDPEATPILSGVRLRNEAIQKIIRLLSLARGEQGRRGRISYVQLGIAQLGAVYETLLSFTGFVARQDLIEVRPASGKKTAAGVDPSEAEEVEDAGDEDEVGEDKAENSNISSSRTDKIDPLAPAWFVPAARASEFTREEIVYVGPNPKIYLKGAFVYRLAGRDRQASASYYTPEPLARLLVKHALMDLTEGMKSDEILKLRILEPAMGSAAFLVESTNQLAELYLERKQKEIGRIIPQESFAAERQRVRAYIADRNCFGHARSDCRCHLH